MRFCLILGVLLAPQMVSAQSTSKDFVPGTYILNNGQSVRQQGQLKLKSHDKLLVQKPDGKNIKYTPDQVSSFWMNDHRYTTADNFIGKSTELKKAFVVLLDSGQVMLMRYDYYMPSGLEKLGMPPISHIFLLKSARQIQLTRVEHGMFLPTDQMFREAVRPYFSGRPDLVKLLDEKIITFNNLPAAIHAVNHNTLFVLYETPNTN